MSSMSVLPGLASLVTATGSPDFSPTLVEYLQAECGADHFAVFQVGCSAPRVVSIGGRDGECTVNERVGFYLDREYWPNDPAMVFAQTQMATRACALMHVDLQRLADPETRELIWPRACDRLVVAGRSLHNTYSISLVREGQRSFSPAAIRNVGHFAELMVALVDKHLALSVRSPQPRQGLGSLAEIVQRIQTVKGLTQREGEVCARVLHGMTTVGIALDLGISPETVKSFRKLAYRRLGLGSARELMQWYLAGAGEAEGRAQEAAFAPGALHR